MTNKYRLMISVLFTVNWSGYVFSNGMFSDITNIIKDLRLAEKENIEMQVIWGAGFMYFQEDGYHGFYNSWEYYFYPIPSRSLEPIDDTDVPDHVGNCFDLMICPSYRCLFHELIERYIHLKPYIRDRINDYYDNYMKNKKVIGVHLRSASKNAEWTMYPLEDIFNKLEEYENYIFYIASDSADFIDRAYRRFPGRCITLDKLNDPLLVWNDVKWGWVIEGSPAQAGEDAVVDAYLLSKCEKIIMTHWNSNLPMYALYLNLDLDLVPIGCVEKF